MKNSIIIFAVLIILFIIPSNAQTFTDDLSADAIGDFPSNWDLLHGTAQVDELYGTKVIRLGNQGTIAPLIDGEDYLGDQFTIEFEIYFDEVRQSINYQSYNLRLWPGIKAGYMKDDDSKLSFRPFKIHRHGVNTHYKNSGPEKGREYSNYITELKGHEPLWRQIKLKYENGKLRVFMNSELILNIPKYIFNPSAVSFEANSVDGKGELTKAIRNISIKGTGGLVIEEPNVIIIINPETEDIDYIEVYTKAEDTLTIKEKHRGKHCFVGRIDGDYRVKNKKIEPLENSTITIYTKNKTITNYRRAKGDLVVMPNFAKASVEKNKGGNVVLKVKKNQEKK